MAECDELREADMSVAARGHRRWVRTCHWLTALSFLTLVLTGILILAVHPRLYWGEAGNSLMPALLEFPLSNNHRPAQFEETVTFVDVPGAPISADRTYSIFNKNGWARSLHFLAAWILVAVGIMYFLLGGVSGHIWRDIVPRFKELAPSSLWRNIREHLKPEAKAGSAGGGPPYGNVQKLAYALVVFVALPLMLITGLTMSPAVTATFPFLLDLFGGYQSARTVHFFAFSFLILFFVVHITMVVTTGFRNQMRAMILGK